MSGTGAMNNQPAGIAARIKERAEANLYEAYPLLTELPNQVWRGLSDYYMGVDEGNVPDNKALQMYCSKAHDVVRDALQKHAFDMEPANKADFAAFLRNPKRVDEYRAALATKGTALKSKLQVSSMPEVNKAADAVAMEQFAAVLEGLAERIDRAVPQRPKTGRTNEV